MSRLSAGDLTRIKQEQKARQALKKDGYTTKVTVHMGTCGVAAGANAVMTALAEEIATSGRKDIFVTTSGCAGLCAREPLATIEVLDQPPVRYCDLNDQKMRDIFHGHIMAGIPVDKLALVRGSETTDLPSPEGQPPVTDSPSAAGTDEKPLIPTMQEIPFFRHQVLRVLRNKGVIDPESIDDYIARDGYQAAAKALTQMKPEDIVKVVKDSGLRGRGGAGFPTGMKWEFASKVPSDVKYMLCNGDEGDPGAFMDRSVMEADPHSVIEGMIIGAKAIGAHHGYIYVRAEYPLAVKRLQLAIDLATERGLLGKDILGTGFDFELSIYLGAGAFVCGEETALMRSLEGKRGMPRPRPPFPAHKGLWDKPSVLNNVETLAQIAPIILHGAPWYRTLGTEKSSGTKVFALTGAISNVGLVEIPMGIPLRRVIYDIGGGIKKKGRKFKAVQLGGPSGGCIPEAYLDTLVTYEDIVATGAIIGSGGMVVMDDTNCMVSTARFFLDFTTDESCGKCPPCRVGTKILLDILTGITEGKGTESDMETLEDLSRDIIATSLCGLGQTAPNPVLTTLRYFRHEYEDHIKHKWCKAGVCRNLTKFWIDEKLCKACGACLRACPAKAIVGEKKVPHKIIQELCVQCRTCYDTCKFNSIRILPAKFEGDPYELLGAEAAGVDATKGDA
ncbi:MAG: NADH-quinone oxidoreductase subunit NuoF [Nitrospirae bacterium]|nr:MAG: NADH-quinone oxidoreductase subunit NuoF [Nitrospirota bacterium]